MSPDTLRFTCLACGDEQLVATDMQEGDTITVSCGQCTHPTTMTAHLLQDGKWAEIQRKPGSAQTHALMKLMSAGDFHAMLDMPRMVLNDSADAVESTTEDHAEQVKGD